MISRYTVCLESWLGIIEEMPHNSLQYRRQDLKERGTKSDQDDAACIVNVKYDSITWIDAEVSSGF